MGKLTIFIISFEAWYPDENHTQNNETKWSSAHSGIFHLESVISTSKQLGDFHGCFLVEDVAK